jgi:hypothetical protein
LELQDLQVPKAILEQPVFRVKLDTQDLPDCVESLELQVLLDSKDNKDRQVPAVALEALEQLDFVV